MTTSVARFAPELRFLLWAYRRSGSDGVSEPFSSAAQDGLDWTKLTAGMGLHGLLWLAAPLLAQGAPPAAAQAELRGRTQDQALRTLRRVAETVRVCRALEAQGVRFLVLKGVPLSVQLHGDPARRAARDLDILVEPGRRAAADVALRQLGYAPPHDGPLSDTGANVAKEVGYVHGESRILVELHDRLADTFELLPWDFETLWTEREAATVGDCAVPTLSRRRLPLYLCVHGAKHGWARLIWLDDMAAVLAAPGAIEQALADAAPLGLRGVMLHAAGLLHDWLGRPVPPAVLAQARASRQVRLLDAVAARLHGDPRWWQEPPRRSWRRFWRGSVQLRLVTYAMKPRWSYWRRQLAHELDSPDDRRWLALPAWLQWLYLPVRPVGWLVRRLTPAWRD